jgi:predicted dehydrogenase
MLNTAIFGLGNWGQTLVRSVHEKSEKIKIAQMVTRDPSKYTDFVDKTGIPISNDYAEILKRDDIEAVIIATGHSAHGEHVEQAAAAGKHVFCEKPFTLTKESALSAVEACDKAGVKLSVAFNRRFNPALMKIREMIESRELGTILHVEGAHSGHAGYDQREGWRSTREENPAGVMCGKGMHVLDLMLMAAGHVKTLDAFSETRILDTDRDDCTGINMRFKSGATGTLSCIAVTANYWRFHVAGSEGWAEMRGESTLATCKLRQQPEITDYEGIDIERAELDGFADYVVNNAPYPVPLEDVVHGVELLEATVASAETKQPIHFE